VNITAKTILFALISTAVASAKTPQQVGAWSVYSTSGNLASDQVVLLQTTSQGQYRDAQGNPVQAKLDVICKKGKLSGIALETNAEIEKSAMSFSGAVPTTRINFASEGGSSASENWAVSDRGYTVTPYSEVFQGKLTRYWAERLSGTQKIAFRFDGKAGEYLLQPTFSTGELSEALSSVGCTY
jgi:hypothetical protein